MHIPADGKGCVHHLDYRDTWVNIPGYGPAKINAALKLRRYLSAGWQNVENLVGVKIDHVAEIEFEGLKSLVNAVGGVTFRFPSRSPVTSGLLPRRDAHER